MIRPIKWLQVGMLLAIVLPFILIYFFLVPLYRLYHSPMVKEQQPLPIVVIDKKTSAIFFVNALNDQHFIDSPKLFLLLIRLQGLTQKLQAGVYQVKANESAYHFLCRVISGDVIQFSFQIIEGTTQQDVAKQLLRAPYLNAQVTDWQQLAKPYQHSEGLLLADTYRYVGNSTSMTLLERARKNLDMFLQNSWQHRRGDLPYRNAYELLISASIIEKESALLTERRLIASVLVNRLKKGMRLQMDPTVIYALGANYHGKLTHNDLSIDSPYNTYRYSGLPPTPIAMVGRDAIDAAANPADTDYLYFVAKGDGSHHFSVNYDQQKQAIKRYLK